MRGVLGVLLLALALLGAPAHANPRIVAVGDLHGDHAAFVAILRAARLIDERGHWAGGGAIFVQTGDVTDRGPDSLRIIRDLQRLQQEAPRAGGRIVALIGNHEAMNVIGDLRYVHPGEYAAFADRDSRRRRDRYYAANRIAIERHYRERTSLLTRDQIQELFERETPLGMIEHRHAWGPNGEIGRWIASNPAVALVEGNLFAHGGISGLYATRYQALTLDQLNRDVAAALRAQDAAGRAILEDPLGPLWYRGLIRRDAGGEGVTLPADYRAPPAEQELELALRAFGARRMIVGHTPNVSGIQFLHDRRLIAIDTGIAAYYRGLWSYLEIVNGEATAHVVLRGRER